MYFILLLLFVIVCRACPSLIVAQPGGWDGFLFRPSRMPFVSVVRLWSPFATASGSVALADGQYLMLYIYICYVIVAVLPLGGWAPARKNMTWCFPTGGAIVLTTWCCNGRLSWCIRLVHMLLPVPIHLRCGTLFVPRLLHPRDETANHRWGIRDGVDTVAELRLVRTPSVA